MHIFKKCIEVTMSLKKSILLGLSLSILSMIDTAFSMEGPDGYNTDSMSDSELGVSTIRSRQSGFDRKIRLNANQCALLSKGSVLRNAGRNLSMNDPIMKLNNLCKRYPYTIAVPSIEAFYAYCTKKNPEGLVTGVIKSPACAELSYLGNSMMLYMYLKGSPEIFKPEGYVKNPKLGANDKPFIGLWKHLNNVVNEKRKAKRGDEKLPFEKGESFERQLEAVMDRDENSRGGYADFNQQTGKRQEKYLRKERKRVALEKTLRAFRNLSPEDKDAFLYEIDRRRTDVVR